MPTDTEAAVREIFRRAVQQDLTRSLRTNADWDRFTDIASETARRVNAETEAFQRDYGQRLAEARQIILREENGIALDQPLPPGTEPQSDKTELDRKADARVRHDHARRLAAIQADETDQYRTLRKSIRARNARQGQARDAFALTQQHPDLKRSR